MQTSSPLFLPGENLLGKHLCRQEGLEDLWLMKPRDLWEVRATLLSPRPAFGHSTTPVPSFCVCFSQKEWAAVVQGRVRLLRSTGTSIASSHARGRHHQLITAPLNLGPGLGTSS